MRRHICHTPAWTERLFSCRGGGIALGGCGRARCLPQKRDGGSTRERAAAASGLAPSALASSGRSAAFGSAAAWLTSVCQPRAATKGAKTTCLKFHRPMRFCRGFSLSLQEALENVRARCTSGRCCTLNSHLLSSRLSFVLADLLAFGLLECLRAASNQQSADTRETCTHRHSNRDQQIKPSRAALAIRIAHLIRQPAEGPTGCPRAPKRYNRTSTK